MRGGGAAEGESLYAGLACLIKKHIAIFEDGSDEIFQNSIGFTKFSDFPKFIRRLWRTKYMTF